MLNSVVLSTQSRGKSIILLIFLFSPTHPFPSAYLRSRSRRGIQILLTDTLPRTSQPFPSQKQNIVHAQKTFRRELPRRPPDQIQKPSQDRWLSLAQNKCNPSIEGTHCLIPLSVKFRPPSLFVIIQVVYYSFMLH